MPHIAPIRKKTELIAEVAILAGQYGQGMKSYGLPAETVIKTDGTILINHQIDVIRRMIPKAEITVIVKHNADKLIRSISGGVKIIENQNLQSNELEDVRLLLNAILGKSVMIIAGNLYFEDDMLYNLPGKSHTIVTRHEKHEDLGVTHNGDNLLDNIGYGLPDKWLGITTLYNQEMAQLKNTACRSRGKMFLHEGLNKITNNHANIHLVYKQCAFYQFSSINDVRDFDENNI